MSTSFLPSLLLPPSWQQNKQCLLYITATGLSGPETKL